MQERDKEGGNGTKRGWGVFFLEQEDTQKQQ